MTENIKFKVIEKKQLAKQVFFYTLSLIEPKEISFKAGQFLNIKIGEKMWKPYSLCSAPFIKDKIELVVDISPGGEGSAFFEKLQVDEEVLGNGPFGTFLVGEVNDLVFIATGSGIAPVRSMILDLFLNKNDSGQALRQAQGIARMTKKKVYLFFGLRYREDVYFFDEFEKYAKEHANFKFYGTVSRPDESWKGLTGRVTDHLEKLSSFADKDFYLCGASEITASLKLFLQMKGVEEGKIHYEEY